MNVFKERNVFYTAQKDPLISMKVTKTGRQRLDRKQLLGIPLHLADQLGCLMDKDLGLQSIPDKQHVDPSKIMVYGSLGKTAPVYINNGGKAQPLEIFDTEKLFRQ